MKAFLMHRDRDVDLQRELPPNADALIQDLELDTLLGAMAQDDPFLLDMARRALLSSLRDPEAIAYRQDVLADCLEQPAIVRELYGLAVAGVETEKASYLGLYRASPDSILHRSVQILEAAIDVLRRLRAVADEHAGAFRSDGFVRLFAMLQAELDDAYFETLAHHLKELRFRRGVLMSAELGRGNKGRRYVLRRLRELRWSDRLSLRGRPGYTFQIADRDEGGFRALEELRGRGINLVANALAQSTDHVLSFFAMLRAELAFYVGALNAHERLEAKGVPTCRPVALPRDGRAWRARGLCDPCLALNLDREVVGNDLEADGVSLVMVTGANQGGKSTFLRALGLAQLMMQCGMFVAAEAFTAEVCAGLFTHYKRDEDSTMTRGKFDEELARMSEIADQVSPGCLVLCNESFAATNEREGSEIARQVVLALLDAGIKVVFVTHMFELADGFHREGSGATLFLRAERDPDGRRTFRLVEGEPLPTSYGEDSYRRIFAPAAGAPGERVASRS
jgi:hypothetical protein